MTLQRVEDRTEDKQVLACSSLAMTSPLMIELGIDHHSFGCDTLKRRPSGQNMFQGSDGPLFSNDCAPDLLKPFYNEMTAHLDTGTRVLLRDSAMP